DENVSLEACVEIPSFDEIYKDHLDFVRRSLLGLGVGPQSVDDAVQDAFLVVYRRVGDFQGHSALTTWLYGIARRVAHDHRRRLARKGASRLPVEPPDDSAATPFENALRAEGMQIFYRCLDELEEAQREVFVLAELQELTVPEIAEVIQVNVNT